MKLRSVSSRLILPVFVLTFVFLLSPVQAQDAKGSLTASVGYLFGGSYSLSTGSVGIDDATDYMVDLNLVANRDVTVQLSHPEGTGNGCS